MYLDSKAATERIPDAGRMQITEIGAPQVTTQTRGPTALVAILVVLFVFALGCAAIVGFPILARSWRAVEAFEEQERDAARAPDGTLGLDSILAPRLRCPRLRTARWCPDAAHMRAWCPPPDRTGIFHCHKWITTLTTRPTEALAVAPTDSDVAQRERSEPEAIVPPTRRSRAAKRV